MVKPEEKTILVVDDEPDIVIFLKTLLEDEGFQVVTANDGDEALLRVREKKPDFISLDLVMPKKSGIRFFYELRKNKEWSKIPVVVVTAHARDEGVRKEMADLFAGKTISGPQVYLEKPVKPQDYVNMVKRELGIEVSPPGAPEQPAVPPAEEMKKEIERLLGAAHPDTLAAALKILREKQTKS
jgi:CheY-like chemotaxis protein